MFESGEIKSHPIRTEPDGFEGLLDGVTLLRKGKVSGQKLVYRTQDRRSPRAARPVEAAAQVSYFVS